MKEKYCELIMLLIVMGLLIGCARPKPIVIPNVSERESFIKERIINIMPYLLMPLLSPAEYEEEKLTIRWTIDYIVGTWEDDKECLWNIAGKDWIYNDPWKWKRIYKFNSWQISDPDLIYPNQILEIPME